VYFAGAGRAETGFDERQDLGAAKSGGHNGGWHVCCNQDRQAQYSGPTYPLGDARKEA
jgi:hypothetical protein